jgi:hypothetical protein
MEPIRATPSLPRWLVIVASIGIGFHLFAILILVMAAPSGPWPTDFGPSPAEPPFFASTLNNSLLSYLKPLHLTHNYHFNTNRTALPSVRFEVILKDNDGNILKNLEFPQAKANVWVQQRQSLLAQGLADDQPFQPPQQIFIPAPGKSVPRVTIWDADKSSNFKLTEFSINDKVLRERPRLFRPSKWSQVLARSYVRYLCREYKAAKGELIRISRETINPVIMIGDQRGRHIVPYAGEAVDLDFLAQKVQEREMRNNFGEISLE